jgi:hypothetical protein
MAKRSDDELKISHEAKEMIALAFEGAGGLPKLIQWAKTHSAAFYTQLYAKLIPLQLNAQSTLDVSVNIKGEEARQKLQSAFLALYEAERDDERAAIDARPAPLVTYTSSTRDADRATIDAERAAVVDTPASRAVDETKQNQNLENNGSPPTRGLRRDVTSYAHPVTAEPSTTAKYYDWMNNGGFGRSRWDNNGGMP